MLFGKSILALVPFVAGLASASAVEERDVCINFNGPVIQVYITTQTVNVPVLYSTNVQTNGAIVLGGTTINIYNAPTQVITVLNSVATQTSSSTATVTVGPNGISTQVGPSINIINYPVYISTYIQQNTIINNNGATIIINNAPTTLITTATGTITQTVTTTSTVTTNVPQATVLVQVAGPNAAVKKARRQAQTAGFLASDGSIVSSCSSAVPLVITNGQLFVAGTSNSYSANSTDTVITFAASFMMKSISTLFAASSSSSTGLTWTNTAFQNNGSAVFFVQNNFLKAQLQGSPPVGAASLATVAASQCVNGRIVATTSTSTSSTATSTSASSTSGVSSLTTSGASSSTTGASTSLLSTSIATTTVTTAVATTSGSSSGITTITTVVTTPVTVATTTTTAAAPPNGF